MTSDKEIKRELRDYIYNIFNKVHGLCPVFVIGSYCVPMLWSKCFVWSCIKYSFNGRDYWKDCKEVNRLEL